MADKAGSKSVAEELLMIWLSGNGEDQEFDQDSFIAKKFRRSKIMKGAIKQAIEQYKQTGNTKVIGGEITFDSSEPDLWLGVRKANYNLLISEEEKTWDLLLFRVTVARYVVVVTVYDYYNFNKGDEVGDGLGSDLNNIGYGLHEMGLGKDYSWTASYTYETKWKVFG